MKKKIERKKHTNIKALTLGKLNLDTILSKLQASLSGLVESNAKDRLNTYGKNDIAHESAPPAIVQFITSFNNPFIYVLLCLAIVSFFTDYYIPLKQGDEDTDLTAVIIIFTMVMLSAMLRFWQEFRSNNAALKLRSMISNTATVYRRKHDGLEPEKIEVPMQEVVPGDIVFLSAGDMIPADIKLIESKDLFVSQAILTGEALPVEKYDTLGAIAEKTAYNHEQNNNEEHSALDNSEICYMGTNVVSGTAKAIALATGADTYFGSLAKSVIGSRAETSFDRGVNSVSWLLIRFMLVMVPVILLINGFVKGDWLEASLFAIAVAVGLTPEMLPMIVSANLSKGALAMAKRKVIVKRLNAIQNLGAMDILCTDKTGTLTQDKIILENHINTDNDEDNSVLKLAWINSYYQTGMRNLLDKAVIHFAEEEEIDTTGFNVANKIDELPFDFSRRRLSIIVDDNSDDDSHLLICKGAVEEVMSLSTFYLDNGVKKELDAKTRQKLFALAEDYNSKGMRVLAVATRRFLDSARKENYAVEDEAELTIHGFLTFLDPPKDSAAVAIKSLQEHGVAIKVLTGDNALVTRKICMDVGLEPGEALLGPEIAKMTEEELSIAVMKTIIFAKVTPMQKSQIIECLQKQGSTVGFLGDGINDASALRVADVGISVNTASDIAKESADIILLESNLQVLEEGIVQGRVTFGNIIKYLNMTASSNFGNVFSVLVASAFIPFLPMMPIHLLIQNLMYDISQLSLPWDTMDREFLYKPRKWDAKNIGRFMIWIGPTSSIFDMTTYALMWYIFSATNLVPGGEALFHSGWFIEGLLSQTLVVHMLRTRKIPFFQSTAKLPVVLMTILITIIGIYIPFSPLGAMVGLVPLPLAYFPWLVLTLVAYCLLTQGMKVLYIKKFGQWF